MMRLTNIIAVQQPSLATREMHRDKYLSPSPTVPVVPPLHRHPIPTGLAPSSPIPAGCRLCPYPNPSHCSCPHSYPHSRGTKFHQYNLQIIR